MDKFESGDKVRLVDTKGLRGYEFSRHIKKNKVYTVRAVKRTGGLLLEEFVVGFKHELAGGGEQGLLPHRFKKVNKRKKSPKRKG